VASWIKIPISPGGGAGRGKKGTEKEMVHTFRKGRVQFFPLDAADWARALKPWLLPLRSAWDWMRDAAFWFIAEFFAIIHLLCT